MWVLRVRWSSHHHFYYFDSSFSQTLSVETEERLFTFLTECGPYLPYIICAVRIYSPKWGYKMGWWFSFHIGPEKQTVGLKMWPIFQIHRSICIHVTHQWGQTLKVQHWARKTHIMDTRNWPDALLWCGPHLSQPCIRWEKNMVISSNHPSGGYQI